MTLSVDLSIVIPALNEADNLPLLLADLRQQAGVQIQIVVVDGGSADSTVEIARSDGALIVSCDPGRASQMNAGARAAGSDSLLFLHADSRMPDTQTLMNSLSDWKTACAEHGACAGHFSVSFTGADTDRLLYRYMQGKTAFNRANCFNGDQGLLISSTFLEQLGGFDEQLHFLEDQRLGEAIRQQGRWITLPARLETSARRFEVSGPRRQWLLMFLIMGAHGAPVPEFLEQAPRLYRNQNDQAGLRITPYLRCYASIMRRQGWRYSLRGWWGLGGFAAGHSWQVFYFVDVLLRRESYPALRFYDRTLSWLAATWPVRLFAALLMITLVFGIAWPLFEMVERRPSTR